MASTTPDSLALRAGLENLPQELYDWIYNLTFTAKPAVYLFADSRFGGGHGLIKAAKLNMKDPTCTTLNPRFPHLLHVDRASRRQFAKSYYGGLSTIISYGTACVMPTVDDKHHQLMSQLIFKYPDGTDIVVLSAQSYFRDVIEACYDNSIASKMIFTTEEEDEQIIKSLSSEQ